MAGAIEESAAEPLAPAETSEARSAVTALATPPGFGSAKALGEELTAFSQQLIADSALSARELTTARSLPELVEIQARQLQALSEAWLRHTERIREIYLAALRGPAGE